MYMVMTTTPAKQAFARAGVGEPRAGAESRRPELEAGDSCVKLLPTAMQFAPRARGTCILRATLLRWLSTPHN